VFESYTIHNRIFYPKLTAKVAAFGKCMLVASEWHPSGIRVAWTTTRSSRSPSNRE